MNDVPGVIGVMTISLRSARALCSHNMALRLVLACSFATRNYDRVFRKHEMLARQSKPMAYLRGTERPPHE